MSIIPYLLNLQNAVTIVTALRRRKEGTDSSPKRRQLPHITRDYQEEKRRQDPEAGPPKNRAILQKPDRI